MPDDAFMAMHQTNPLPVDYALVPEEKSLQEQLNDDAKATCKDQLLQGSPYGAPSDNIGECRVDDAGNDFFYTAYSSNMKHPHYSAYFITPEEANKVQGGRRSFRYRRI